MGKQIHHIKLTQVNGFIDFDVLAYLVYIHSKFCPWKFLIHQKISLMNASWIVEVLNMKELQVNFVDIMKNIITVSKIKE